MIISSSCSFPYPLGRENLVASGELVDRAEVRSEVSRELDKVEHHKDNDEGVVHSEHAKDDNMADMVVKVSPSNPFTTTSLLRE